MIYEKDDFFLPHKDSEKEPGMFATLIVGLPCQHEGGELIVRFDGKTRKVDFSDPANQYQLPFAAFYADCEHEIKPLRSGYRICLVYNLVQKDERKKMPLQQLGTYADQLSDLLKKMANDTQMPKIILLGHQYTPSNFTMATLKLHDRPRAEVLLQAAEKAGYYAWPALLTSYVIGQWEEDYEAQKRKSSYPGSEKPFEDEMGEIFDESLEVKHWMPGGLPPLKDLTFKPEDLISPIVLNEGKPMEKSETGYTGNAGMELEYWYHYGAVLFWPCKRHVNILFDLPDDNKLEWLAYYNQHWDECDRTDVKRLAESDFQIGEKLDFSPLAAFLVNLQDREYLLLAGKEILVNHLSQISIEGWVKLFDHYGANDFIPIFDDILQRGQSIDLEHQLTIVQHLFATGAQFAAFVSAQTERIPFVLQTVNLAELPKARSRQIFREVLTLSEIKSGDLTWQENTAKAITRILTRDYVNDVLIEVVLKAGKETLLGQQVLAIGLGDLRQRVKDMPQPPADLSRPVPVNQYSSKIWMMLSPFLKSPTLEVFDYRAAESLRRTMEDAVKSVTIDLKMETITKGSPYTLRITKTQAAYLKALAAWESDVRLLRKAEGKRK